MNYVSYFDRLNRTFNYAINFFILYVFIIFVETEPFVSIIFMCCLLLLIIGQYKSRYIEIVNKEGKKANVWRRGLRILVNVSLFILFLICCFLFRSPFMEALSVSIEEPSNIEEHLLDAFINSLIYFPFFALFCLFVWSGAALVTPHKQSLTDMVSGTYLVYDKDRMELNAGIRCLMYGPKALRTAFTVFLISILFAWAGLVLYNGSDERLTPEAEAFFNIEPFNPENNFYVALAGIYAPEGTDDIYAYGRKVVMEGKEAIAPNALELQGADDFINCTSQKDPEDQDCSTAKEARAIFEKNPVLFARYKDLWDRENLNVSVGDKFYIDGLSLQTIIKIHRVLLVSWLDIAPTGQGDRAMQEWLASTKMTQRIMNGKIGIVDQAVWLIIYNNNLKTLPSLLDANPSLISEYEQSMKAVLKKDSQDIWNVEKTWEAEANAINLTTFMETKQNNYFFKPHATKNNFYNMSREVIKLYDVHIANFDQKNNELEKKYKFCEFSGVKVYTCFVYNPIGKLLLQGILKGNQLYKNAKLMDLYQKALIIWINARQANIPADEMGEFVRAQDQSLTEPTTELPLEWNPETQSIHATLNGEKLEKTEVFYEN